MTNKSMAKSSKIKKKTQSSHLRVKNFTNTQTTFASKFHIGKVSKPIQSTSMCLYLRDHLRMMPPRNIRNLSNSDKKREEADL
jgi:hypothetical protein